MEATSPTPSAGPSTVPFKKRKFKPVRTTEPTDGIDQSQNENYSSESSRMKKARQSSPPPETSQASEPLPAPAESIDKHTDEIGDSTTEDRVERNEEDIGAAEEGGDVGEEGTDLNSCMLASLVYVIDKDKLEAEGGRYLYISPDEEHEVVIFSHRGSIYAIQNSCPHAGGPLCEGTIKDIEDLEAPYSFPSPPLQHKNVSSFAADRDEPSIVCPLHAFRFGLVSGLCSKVMLGALRAKVYRTQLIHNRIFIELA